MNLYFMLFTFTTVEYEDLAIHRHDALETFSDTSYGDILNKACYFIIPMQISVCFSVIFQCAGILMMPISLFQL